MSVLDKVAQDLHHVRDVIDPAAHSTAKALGLSRKDANTAVKAVITTGQFLQQLQSGGGQAHLALDAAHVAREYGPSVARYTMDHPGDVAMVAGLLALAAPTGGATALALTALAATAGAVQTGVDVHDRHYTDAALDLASIALAVPGAGGDIVARAADDTRVAEKAAYAKRVDQAIRSRPEVPALSPLQKRDIATIIRSLRSASSRAEVIGSRARRIDVASAFIGAVSGVHSHISG